MKKLFLLTLSASITAANIVITFDDFPMPQTRLFSAQERTTRLINACKHHNCKTVFFCIGNNIIQNPRSADHLTLAARNGHSLANHTMTHSAFSSLSLEQFRDEIKGTENLLAPYPTMKKWFRYPYLDYGSNKKKGGSIKKLYAGLWALDKLGYSEGYVSINTYDWHINARLQQALKMGKTIDYAALKHVYIALLQEWCQHYIALYKKFFTPEITHTLLFHANDINALYLDDIIAMIKKNGWTIVSPELAFENTGWRKSWIRKIFKNPELVQDKPDTLSLPAIDAILEKNKCFT